MTTKRTETVIIRLTSDEKQSLLLRKTKPRLAEWLRELALGQKPKRQPKSVDPALLFELNRIGVNLNQIARHCHQTPVSMETVNIALALRHIEAQLREVLDRAD
ncbi:TPA: MobC family plasmid mobilization relaxosome protein [Proteus mirabilis]|nr:MobC family plasmid mobilization relaxosome protein [Proteus mirabilis]